jgi:erythronate-4-phosphate dehydrogenase
MKIVADENIPLLDHYFGDLGELLVKPGRAITHEDVRDADLLLVRSVTHVDKHLLENSSVKFVGSATTGADHLDTHWLNEAGIRWAIARGCNSEAVAEYVVCVIAALQKMEYLLQNNPRAGVIGVGNVGRKVVDKLTALGFEVIVHDPVRAQHEKDFVSTPLEAFTDLDLVSIHTPLTHQGDHPTFHMIDKQFLSRQKKESILLNAGRGSVINFADLKHAGQYLNWCLDVWEHEPKIDLEILGTAVIATPHIAGYSVQAKYRGTEMIYQEACEQGVIIPQPKSEVIFPSKTLTSGHSLNDWRDVVLKIYDPRYTSQQIKEEMLSHHDTFDHLRKHFSERHEFAFVNVRDARLSEDDVDLLKRLGLCHLESVVA